MSCAAAASALGVTAGNYDDTFDTTLAGVLGPRGALAVPPRPRRVGVVVPPSVADIQLLGGEQKIAGKAAFCAAAVVALLGGTAVNTTPMLTNTCYSMTTDEESVHVASVHQYDTGKKTMLTVAGSGGISVAPTALEGDHAMAWAQNIWTDVLA